MVSAPLWQAMITLNFIGAPFWPAVRRIVKERFLPCPCEQQIWLPRTHKGQTTSGHHRMKRAGSHGLDLAVSCSCSARKLQLSTSLLEKGKQRVNRIVNIPWNQACPQPAESKIKSSPGTRLCSSGFLAVRWRKYVAAISEARFESLRYTTYIRG
jgi:hypothetical protein